MEENSIKKKFFRFLKDEGAFAAFKHNFNNATQIKNRLEWCKNDSSFTKKFKIVSPIPITDFCENMHTPLIIQYSFDWSKTTQGHYFWEIISQRWMKKVVNNYL